MSERLTERFVAETERMATGEARFRNGAVNPERAAALCAEIRIAWQERDEARAERNVIQENYLLAEEYANRTQAVFEVTQEERDAAGRQVAELRGYLTRIRCLLPGACPGPEAEYDEQNTCIRCGALSATRDAP